MNSNKKNFYFLIPSLIGKNALNFIITIGTVVSFLLFAISKAIIPPFYINEYLYVQQFLYRSISIASLLNKLIFVHGKELSCFIIEIFQRKTVSEKFRRKCILCNKWYFVCSITTVISVISKVVSLSFIFTFREGWE